MLKVKVFRSVFRFSRVFISILITKTVSRFLHKPRVTFEGNSFRLFSSALLLLLLLLLLLELILCFFIIRTLHSFCYKLKLLTHIDEKTYFAFERILSSYKSCTLAGSSASILSYRSFIMPPTFFNRSSLLEYFKSIILSQIHKFQFSV